MADEKDRLQPKAVPGAPATPAKTDTSRIDLADAEAPPPRIAPHETLNIKDVVKGAPVPPKAVPAKPVTTVAKAIPTAGPKTSTSRISLDAALTETSAMDEASKDATVRVDLTAIQAREAARTGGVIPDAQKNRTARIRIEEPAPDAGDTAHIALGSDTTHITLGEGQAASLADTDHIATGERADETTHIRLPGAEPPPPPKTIRIARPAALPKTVVLPRPDAADAPPTSTPPKTVALKRPGVDGEEEKGSTSRIAVPEGIVQAGPVTQRKTIRIKRPDSPASGGKTLVIARPARAASVKLPASAQEQVEEVVRELKQDEMPGAAYAILAIAATIVAAALVYVLAAQAIAPNLPMPGRLL